MKKTLQLLLLTLLLSATSVKAQLTDVWDFGAEQLDTALYSNKLNATNINAWYTAAAGTSGISLPATWTVGALTWTGSTSDRLRTTNIALTRFDTNIASVAGYTGRLYANGTTTVTANLPNSRYFSLVLNEDDEVKIIGRSDADGLFRFVNAGNTALQNDSFPSTSASGATTEINVAAKNAGTFRIYDAVNKISVYRIQRKAATYVTITGNIDLTAAAGIPSNYNIVYTNPAGKSWNATINSGTGTYSITVPANYTYNLSLINANGYIISNGTSFPVSVATTTHDVVILGLTLYTVTGNITGLGTAISGLSLTYTPSPTRTFVPVPVINSGAGTYSVQLEGGVAYSIAAFGVNDYNLTTTSINVSANSSSDLVFTPKPTNPITINTIGLNVTQLSSLNLKFTNLNEPTYSYTFTSLTGIALRNGTYKVTATNLDNYPVEQVLTSNLVVNNAAVSKTLTFNRVTVWSFDDKVINSTTTAAYKGMIMTGQVTTVVASGHMTAKSGATIQVPVNVGEKIKVSYYYTANFSIEGGAAITTATNSTSILEHTEYTYTGAAAGVVNIAVGGVTGYTTYITEIKIGGITPYTPTITVGVGKDYQIINDALKAVANMVRPTNQRVTILIDPANYEEMLVINLPNITLKNASATPDTNLTNSGVNISPNAVRVTSYYGHGYNYFSMSNDQKWHADVLGVNIENGTISYTNAGSGTTNNSYWNATVVVDADGFEAENIIFENSFNQYISTKESQDVVQTWGTLPTRSTTAGSTSVQAKTMVERAAAFAIKNNIQKTILYKCRVIGRQDSFFGGTGSRVAIYKGDMMGATDYLFGGMVAVFYQSKLTMNTSEASTDVCYITAAQQSSGRGYLMYNCTITSATPGTETASTYQSKPGYFGRPWAATTSEVVFYNTNIETSNNPSYLNQSLILPLGWNNSLSGNSVGMCEFGTTEVSGVNNTPSRATWATTLAGPTLLDGTPINTFNFTKGTDNWDPFPTLIANDNLGNESFEGTTAVNVLSFKNTISISNISSKTAVNVYTISGQLVKSFITNEDTNFTMNTGLWIVSVKDEQGQKSVKVVTF